MNANDPASIEARIRATETETAQLAGHARASRWSRRVFAACVASLLLAEVTLWSRALWWFPQLPERFPVHFNASGTPDRWSERGAAWFLLPGLSLGIIAFFGLIAWGIKPLVHGAPGLVNVPQKDLFVRLSAAGREVVLAPTRAYLAWVISLVAWLFVWILEGSARVAVGQAATLSSWPVFVFLALILGTLLPFYLITSRAIQETAKREGLT
ncbi:MAG: hypothetical protein RL591_2610 [Planctomycetota bacterium]